MAKKTKTELYNAVVEELSNILDSQGVYGDTRTELLGVVDKYLKPGVFGVRANIEEFVARDEQGNIERMQCSLCKFWYPATAEFFYEDKRSNRIIGTDGKSLRRLSRAAEKCRKQHLSEVAKATKEVQKGIMEGKISGEEAQVMLNEIKARTIDFSSARRPSKLKYVGEEDNESTSL